MCSGRRAAPMLLALAVVLAALVLQLERSRSAVSSRDQAASSRALLDESWKGVLPVVRRVEVVRWAPDVKIDLDALVVVGEPVVIRGARISACGALERWKQPGYLESRLRVLHNVSVSRLHTFATADYGPAMRDGVILADRVRDTYETQTMSAEDFVRRIHNRSSADDFLYHYMALPDALRGDVQPGLDELWLHASDREAAGAYLWLSGAGVRPAIHFDTDHNLFVHLGGVKHFYLWAPWDQHHLAPYPRVHPLWHKSACDPANLDAQQCPTWHRARAIVADLQPGDVLYVPPHWWHQPISMTPCVSLATWSRAPMWPDSLTHIYYGRTMAFADAALERATRATLLHTHFASVFRAIYNRPASAIFAMALNTRWRFLSRIRGPVCELRDVALSATLTQQTRSDVDFVVATLRAMMPHANAAGNYRRAVIATEVLDYAERMIARTLGADAVHAFIACAATDDVHSK